MIFFSFIGAPSIFKVLPRDKAGDVVGDIFPKYWMMGYVCSAIALLTILIISFQKQGYNLVKISILVLMSCLNLYSGMVVGAKAREVKARIRSLADTKEKEVLMAEFGVLHRRSTILNGIILLLGLVAIFFEALD